MKKQIGLYLHIPFCKSKCYYCDFISYAGKEEKIEEYVEAILREIKQKNLEQYTIRTIYIGGGTPSLLNEKQIIKVLTEITKKQNPEEITIEINPGTVTEQKIKTYKDASINRLSIGLQATQNSLLKQLR